MAAKGPVETVQVSQSYSLEDDNAMAIHLAQQFEAEDKRLLADLAIAEAISASDDFAFERDVRLAREMHAEEAKREAQSIIGRHEAKRLELLQQMQDDEALARSFEQQQFVCSVCLDDCPIDSIFELPDTCDHDEEVCRDCARRWVVTKMEESRFPIPCPVGSCANSVHPDRCQLILDEAEMIKFLNLSLEHWADQSGEAYHCPTPDCKGLVCMDGERTYALCPSCDNEWCVACKTAWHQGSSCEEYQEWRKSNDPEGKHVEELMKVNNWRSCPNCAAVVEKSEGCNHMTCRCTHHFCYLCGEILAFHHQTNYYAHFQTGRCSLFDVNNPLYRAD